MGGLGVVELAIAVTIVLYLVWSASNGHWDDRL